MRLSAWSACVALAAAVVGTAVAREVQAPPPSDNAELTRMFQEDQDDRKPGLQGIDWSVVKPRAVGAAPLAEAKATEGRFDKK
jgi:hypothetical protein